MKLIDAWLFFGLVLPFVAFFLEVAEALALQNEQDFIEEKDEKRPITVSSNNSVTIQPEKFYPQKDNKKNKSKMQSVIQFLSQRFLPGFTIIFILSYTIVCIYSYNNPVLEYD